MEKISFSEYFYNWLYGQNGYYANYKQIGKEGDFYTSVSTSSFFGGSIAKRVYKNIKDGFLPKNTTIVEVGAHHGYLLADIIQFLYTFEPKLLNTLNFAIVERFDKLQEQQIKYLNDSFGDAINLTHYKSIDELNLDNAFVIANEIFDAFPCELVFTKNSQLEIAKIDNHEIIFEKCEDENILKDCNKYKITKGEVPVGYKEFINSLCKNIKKFEFVTFDYGDKYPRNDFSIRVYEKHKTFPLFEENLDLKKLFAISDITYDVSFSYLIDCFKDLGIHSVEYKTQMATLIDFGIIELLEMLKENVDENSYLREAQKIKTLIEPTGMGDRFKALIVKKQS